MSDCRKCAKFEECAVDEDCGLFKPKPLTNADRIRAMSDEELAGYLANICYDLFSMFVADPKKVWLDWLKSPVKEEE